jgi:hypothetical protein
MNSRLPTLACLPLALLAGCAIHQNIRPVEAVADAQVCIIVNPEVRPSVMAAYKKALGDKGYNVRELPQTAATTDCKVTSTYRANWHWDLAM